MYFEYVCSKTLQELYAANICVKSKIMALHAANISVTKHFWLYMLRISVQQNTSGSTCCEYL
jgi:hypothetical protein